MLRLLRHPSLYKALSSEEPVERRKASACLSRIGRAVTAVQASEKEREADSNVIKDAVKPLLRFQPEAGGAVADDSKGACPFVLMYVCRQNLYRIPLPEAIYLLPIVRCCLMRGLRCRERFEVRFAADAKYIQGGYSGGRVTLLLRYNTRVWGLFWRLSRNQSVNSSVHTLHILCSPGG